MPQRDHHSVLPAESQGSADQDWQQVVQQRLPADLEVQARRLGAFVRARGVPSAQVLLRGLLYYVLSHSSLRQVSAWSRLIGLTRRVISGQAWHKRLLASADWLLWLFNALLAAPTGRFCGRSQRILLVDATHVCCRDKDADTWRVHYAYDLLAGRLAFVRVCTWHIAEGFAQVLLRVGDSVVGDGAYSRAKQLLAGAKAGAFSPVRSSPAHLPLYAPHAPAWTAEYRVEVPAWLRRLRPGLYERPAMVVEQAEHLPVRLLALVLPEAHAFGGRALFGRLRATADDPTGPALVGRAPRGTLSRQMAGGGALQARQTGPCVALPAGSDAPGRTSDDLRVARRLDARRRGGGAPASPLRRAVPTPLARTRPALPVRSAGALPSRSRDAFRLLKCLS